jgi:hypothetical protein
LSQYFGCGEECGDIMDKVTRDVIALALNARAQKLEEF